MSNSKLLAGALILLAGCQAPTTSQTAFQRQAIPIARTETTVPIAFEKVVIKLPRGQSVGSIQATGFCSTMDDLMIRTGKYRLDDDTFTDIFREELLNENYNVVGDPDALFNDPARDKARFLIAGLITEIEANICYPNINMFGQRMGFGNPRDSKGASYLKVEWQIFDTRNRQIVYKTNTDGSSQIITAASGSFNKVLELAFSVAVNNLMANETFHNLMIDKATITNTDPTFGAINVNFINAAENNQARALNSIKDSVVTIKTGQGHGSGFLISEDGYIITNAHVVGGSDTVAVAFENGMEVEGKVIRSAPARDVALVKITLTKLSPLLLQTQLPDIGSNVYAVGAPLELDLHGTMSSGIISSHRTLKDNGMDIIQSDIMINGGNSGGPMINDKGEVIAISVSGIAGGTGINFFIPIQDALNKLNIEIPINNMSAGSS